MPDRRRPAAGPVAPALARVDFAAIAAAIKGARQPVDLDTIAAAIEAPRGRVHSALKIMKRKGAVRWITRPLGGPGYALPRGE